MGREEHLVPDASINDPAIVGKSEAGPLLGMDGEAGGAGPILCQPSIFRPILHYYPANLIAKCSWSQV